MVKLSHFDPFKLHLEFLPQDTQSFQQLLAWQKRRSMFTLDTALLPSAGTRHSSKEPGYLGVEKSIQSSPLDNVSISPQWTELETFYVVVNVIFAMLRTQGFTRSG